MDIQKLLAEPFEESDVSWKPQAVKGSRAMAIAYIDARNVMDRLDAVVGLANWKDEYELVDGGVVCHLSVKIDGEWIHKSDVGSYSDQPDGGDRLKSAFSDSLKRAAVKFGIGRYLYRLDNQWVDYDPSSKKMATPSLPGWARPDRTALSQHLRQEFERAMGAAVDGPGLAALAAEMKDNTSKMTEADVSAVRECYRKNALRLGLITEGKNGR